MPYLHTRTSPLRCFQKQHTSTNPAVPDPLDTLRFRFERTATDRPHPADDRRDIVVVVVVVVRVAKTKFVDLDRDVFRFREEKDERRKRKARRRRDCQGGQEGELRARTNGKKQNLNTKPKTIEQTFESVGKTRMEYNRRIRLKNKRKA